MSVLGKYAHLWREVDDGQRRVICARAWHDLGLIWLDPEWVNGWADRELVEQLAKRLYGKRDAQR